jgi:predicted anti-sigma-YlaC factor YlaD
MECDRMREAISARIDGEDPGAPAALVEAHLAECAACRSWQQRAHAVSRRTRLGGSFLDHDLTPRVLAAVPPSPAGRPALALRAGLLAVALAQLAITVPLLVLGHDHDAGTHAAHELGSFDLALAIAFAVGAIRPVLSAGLAWPSGIAAAGLAGTAIADLVNGQTIGMDEAQHLIALAGAALLCWQARTVRAGAAGPAIADGHAQPDAHPAAGTVAAYLLEGPPDAPGGGASAARVAGPGSAARRTAQPPASTRPDGGHGQPVQHLAGQGRPAPDRSGEQGTGEAVA